MRTVTGAIAAAAAAQISTPDLRLELADIWPHFATVATSGNGGPCAAAIAPDGSALAAYVSTTIPNTVSVQRVTDPSNAGQWTSWTAISTDARAQAGVCLCVAGATVRLLWQAAATTAVLHADSTDNGQTWSAPATLYDPGKPCYGLAADGDLAHVFIAYDPGGLGFIRVAAWTLAGTWSGADWTNGDLNTIVGLAAALIGPGQFGLVLALQTATGEAYSIQSTVYTSVGPSWTALAPIVVVDTSVGLVVRYPHLARFDGMYRLAYQIQDTGSVSGISYTRLARTASADFLHWQAGLEDSQSFPSGAAWIAHASAYLLVAPEAVGRAPLYNPASNYRDLTADIARLDLIEREGAPARLIVTLDNSSGAYTALPLLLPNAQLLLSQGFAGAGLAPTHLLYIDLWTFARAADEATVTLVAQDRARFLARQTRYPLSYTNRSLAYILQDLAALAGFDQPATIDSAAQWTQVVALFQIPAGQTYLSALQRLIAAYDGAYSVRTVIGGGTAFGVVDLLAVSGKSGSQPVVWTAPAGGSAGEPEYLHLTHIGDRANHLVVYGPQKVPAVMADAWDFVDSNTVGQERYALIVEGFAGTTAAATLATTAALAREGRLATRLALAIGPQPALELFDAISVVDTALPSTTGRIVELIVGYHPGAGSYELLLTCEGL